MIFDIALRVPLGSAVMEFHIQSDEPVVFVVGPNGSGKTTLLRAISGAIPEVSGRISVGGNVLLDTSEKIDLPIEKRRVGYQPQGFGLFPHLSAYENLAFPLRLRGISADQIHARCRQVLESMGVLSVADRRPSALSGGEQQRVALGRALLSEPQLLLLDEPLSALDVRARREMRAFLLEQLRRTQTPTLFVTHDVRDVRAFGAPLFIVEDGRVLTSGTEAELVAAPQDEFLTEFLAVPPQRQSEADG